MVPWLSRRRPVKILDNPGRWRNDPLVVHRLSQSPRHEPGARGGDAGHGVDGERILTDIRGQAAPGQGQGARPQNEKSRIVVPFDDNRLLANLLGEYDSHVALLEDRLGIDAHAHGNVVILTGSDTNCEIAREVLEELYKRAAAGEQIGPGDFDGAIRHARQQAPPGETTGPAQVATRRRVIKARTPMQSTYMRAIEHTDLVFGIGPAGTGKTYLAVAFAAHFLEQGVVERIILSRPGGRGRRAPRFSPR